MLPSIEVRSPRRTVGCLTGGIETGLFRLRHHFGAFGSRLPSVVRCLGGLKMGRRGACLCVRNRRLFSLIIYPLIRAIYSALHGIERGRVHSETIRSRRTHARVTYCRGDLNGIGVVVGGGAFCRFSPRFRGVRTSITGCLRRSS